MVFMYVQARGMHTVEDSLCEIRTSRRDRKSNLGLKIQISHERNKNETKTRVKFNLKFSAKFKYFDTI